MRYSDQLPLFTLAPRYNIAPTQDVLAVTFPQNNRVLSLMRWGLIPSWSNEPSSFINARAETLEEKPSFSESFQRRRCLIPADGFYEWQRKGRSRQPHYFQMSDETNFAFAGVWDVWTKNEVSITSCSIITTTANELVATVHDRMPVILSGTAQVSWLDRSTSLTELRALLVPFPATGMKSFPVSSKVNQSRVDEAQLVEPFDLSRQSGTGMLFE